MDRVELNTRKFLSDWRFWVCIAYLGLSFLTVWLYVLNGREARATADRAAAQRSAASSQVATCFTSAKNAPVIRGFLDGQDALIDNGLLANEAAVKAAPADDPLLPVRLKAIVRLTTARENSRRLEQLIVETTPTKKKCLVLARKLGVDASRYIQQ